MAFVGERVIRVAAIGAIPLAQFPLSRCGRRHDCRYVEMAIQATGAEQYLRNWFFIFIENSNPADIEQDWVKCLFEKSQVRKENQENNGWEIGRDSQKKEGCAAASAKRQNSAVIAYAVAAAKRVWRKNVRKQSEQSNAESSWSHR